MNQFYYETRLGRIGIAEESGSITGVYFESETIPENAEICETEIIKEAHRQLDDYLAGELKEFSLPLAPHGTDFTKSVWKHLCDIPYGETRSYKDIAIAAGNSKAVRAVGQANNRNPIPIFIPCHRVIGINGKLVGYGGGLEIKEKLLELEGRK